MTTETEVTTNSAVQSIMRNAARQLDNIQAVLSFVQDHPELFDGLEVSTWPMDQRKLVFHAHGNNETARRIAHRFPDASWVHKRAFGTDNSFDYCGTVGDEITLCISDAMKVPSEPLDGTPVNL